MNDTTVKKWLPQLVRVTLLLLVTVLFLCLCGCSTKSTVSCISRDPNMADELSRPLPQFNENGDVTEALREYYNSWQGTRYRYGGLSRNGVDCSGLTLLTFKELFGKDLPRTVWEQVKEGTKIPKTSLQAGDLVFFNIGRYQKHVGIYLEDDLFIHASRSSGVMISSLNNVYWQKRYWQAQRL